MEPRDRFIRALERKPIKGKVPHFELVFYLTMEAFGKVHPLHRNYSQWDQMTDKEKNLQRKDIAEIYVKTAEVFHHDAIFLHPNPGTIEETIKLIELVREMIGNKYFLMIHGDATFGIPSGEKMMGFIEKIADEPEKVKKEADDMVNKALERTQILKKKTYLDGFALCSDYCFNSGPFLSPSMFSEFITPYLEKLIKGYRDMGFYTIKHTDGNIMPIIDQLIQAKPDALHSLDPQAGVDIKIVKKLYGDKVCLIGNVNCGLLQTGTDQQVIESCIYALKNGMPGYGYIFSSSNCIYTGMPLERYKLMLKVWEEYGNYD
ncbi:MAG: uroporphyrinogen decarboxylase family protein [Candidatus Ratteibacteria bacterium]